MLNVYNISDLFNATVVHSIKKNIYEGNVWGFPFELFNTEPSFTC